MKCKVCGNESGKYPLCRACNIKREKGEIIKCEKCNNWHYASADCEQKSQPVDDCFLYDLKDRFISKNEQTYFSAIKASVPLDYFVFPQVNLSSFIERTDNARFRNELFRNIDFLITDKDYRPKIAVEINDSTHLNAERKERDEKILKICEEAGIPLIKFWTSYGVNQEYIKSKIDEVLLKDEIQRIHHFNKDEPVEKAPEVSKTEPIKNNQAKKKKGCYIATCVYGSYDCPPVWTLRRYRDTVMANSVIGRIFIFLYYLLSPTVVKLFGKKQWFVKPVEFILNKIVLKLERKGFSGLPYSDA